MKHFNFPIRNPDRTFYAQVHLFDSSYFAVKVHPTGAPSSRFITCNSPCCNISSSNLHTWSSQCISSLTFRNTWLRMMEPCVLMHGCVHEASIRYPTLLKLILAIWCTMDPEAMFVTNLLLRPVGGLYSTLAVEHPTIRHLDYECAADVP